MLKVLVLEDDSEKLRSVVELLIQANATTSDLVDSVPDAFTARRLLRENVYDFLILDLVVPERLGGHPDVTAGQRLLEDLYEDSRLHMPGQILGLTGFEDLASAMADAFLARGVILIRYEDGSEAWQGPIVMQTRQLQARKRAESSVQRDFGSYLGIVCALEVEFDAVQRLPWGFTEVEVAGDPTLYIRGEFDQRGERRNVVAALCPRMGMSAAAITATKLIGAFRPELLAMTGITAAVRGQANLGDVIVADECWDWGMGKWQKQGGEVQFRAGPHHLSLDGDLRSLAVRLGRQEDLLASIQKHWPAEVPATALKVVVGPVVSGSAVVAARELTEQIAAQHRKLVGIEMEAYGVYAAAAEAVMPRPRAIALKAVSDFADEQKGDHWRHYGAYASAEVLRYLAEQYL